VQPSALMLSILWINLKCLFILCKWFYVVGHSVVFEYFLKAVKQVLAHSVLELILRKKLIPNSNGTVWPGIT